MEQEKIDEGIINLLGYIRAVDSTMYQKFVEAPASTKWHNDYAGGLLDHSKRVTYKLCQWKDEHPNSNLSYFDCIITGILHDLCKYDLYVLGEDGKYKYNETKVKRHACYSLELIKGLGISLTPMQRIMILLHMNGWQSEEDWGLLSKEDQDLLQDKGNFAMLQAMCWADMRATQEETLIAKEKVWTSEKEALENKIKELEGQLNGK